ncbi:MAG: hypothetical protein CMH32_05025 [Micavibrio sp.]|nr:hypothetical protein [Micavibrio sp.]HCK32907.1 hypothetical protein [Rhodospirillaceae bacterium]
MSNKNVIIFHGTKGSPQGNWFPWLSAELLAKDYDVFMPHLPTPQNQDLETWLKISKRLPIDENTILIGHSCGATFIPHLLASLSTPIDKAILVSPFTGNIGIDEYDQLNASFVDERFENLDFSSLPSKTKELILFYGDNDPYVPIDQPLQLAKQLNVNPICIKNGGHLNSEGGYDNFPELLEKIHG